jgi:hypothetical protein
VTNETRESDRVAAILDDRRFALGGGILLVGLGVVVSVATHDSAVAAVITLAGLVLLLYAVLWDRLKSFGPGGVELFEKTKERAARRVDRALSDTISIRDDADVTVGPEAAPAGVGTGSGQGFDATVSTSSGQAATAIRAAETPEEVIERLLLVIDQLSSQSATQIAALEARLAELDSPQGARRQAERLARGRRFGTQSVDR